jgi:multidrug efflux pump subunit AcrB
MGTFVDPETKRASYQKLAQFLFIAVTAAATASIAYWAVLGLLYWIAAGFIWLFIASFAPAVGQWFANMKIAALKAVIEANPIETMETIYEQKRNELNAQASAIEQVDTQYRNVEKLIKDLKNTDPEEAKDYEEIKDKIGEGLDELNREFQACNEELTKYKGQIDKARRLYKVQKAINTALDVSEAARSEFFADLKKQVAFDKVNTDLNKAFSRLNMAVERRKIGAVRPKAALPSKSNVEVIDLGEVKEKTPIRRIS